MFISPMEEARKEIKGKIIAWQQVEEEKARKEQARLQAEADEKARIEREKLEAQAAKLKTPEKKEERLTAAAAVIAPTISVAAPTVNIRTQKVWKVKNVNIPAFLQACINKSELQGYIEIKLTALARAKAANSMFEAAGIEFEQVTR
jgi:hypothetical protein